MAMFVLVVDTSLMNVSISAVVDDLDTTASGVQSAIALEALVSAAFILIGSKIGDLIGRKRAYVLGLLGYAIGALAMTLAQSLPPIIIFWAIIGGLGASLLLPAMQSLIHGNFEGAAQRKAYALVGASAAIAAAVGPLLGGFITTYLSWRVGFLARGRDHRGRPARHQARQGRAVHRRPRRSTSSARCSRCSAWAGSCSASSSGRRAASAVGALIAVGVRRARRARLLAAPPQAAGQAGADRPGPLHLEGLPARHLRADAAADRARRADDRAADLPADGVRVQRDGGRALARAALAHDVRRRAARREAGREAQPGALIRIGFGLLTIGVAALIPIVPRADSGWWLVDPAGRRRRRPRAARLAAQQLHALADRGGARQRGGRRQLGGRLVRALVRARVRRRDHALDAVARLHEPGERQRRCSRPPSRSRSPTPRARRGDHEQHGAQELIKGEPPAVQEEIIDINTDARHIALQIALIIPLLAGLLGFLNSFRMMRLPDPKPSGAAVIEF